MKDSIYVDDIGDSFPNSEKAQQTITKVDKILAKGKFSTKTWNSNHTAVDVNPCTGSEADFLGHIWKKSEDTFMMKPKSEVLPNTKLSKRNVLGLVMKFWDPLGFLLPVTMKY